MVKLKNPFKFGTDLWDPSSRFETSWLLSPWTLFFFRAIFALYILVARLFIIGYTCTHESLGGCAQARRSFSYFTVLTYWGLGFYFLAAAVHTFSYAISGRPLLDHLPRPLQALHSLFYTTVITYPFLVTIVYWGVLYEGPWFKERIDAWANISQHAINSLFALFEIIFPRTSPPLWIHLLWLMIILMCYLAVAYITYADQGWYTYNFLDYKEVDGQGIVAAYCIGIAVAIVIIFCVVYGLIWVRRWLTETKLGMDGKFAEQPQHNDTEMGTVGSKYAIGNHSETPDRAYVQ